MLSATCANQTGEEAQRFLICVAHMTEKPPEDLGNGHYKWEQYTTDNTTCLVCKPTYRRMLGTVTVSGDESVPANVSVAIDAISTPIPSLSA